MAVKELQGIDKVKELYAKIPMGGEKTAFFDEMEKVFRVKKVSLKTNWFSGLFGVPTKYIPELIERMEKYNSENNFI